MKGYGVFFTKKNTNKILLCQINFLIICNLFFVLTIYWSGDKQRFCFSEIYWFNQSGIPYLSIVHIMASRNYIRLHPILTVKRKVEWVWFALRYERILWSLRLKIIFMFLWEAAVQLFTKLSYLYAKIRTLLHSRRM